MGGAKGCNDDCGAAIIYIVNGLLVLGTLVSLAFIIYVWVTQGDLVKGGQDALSLYVPEVILIVAIIIFVMILAISLLGIISTCRQMKHHEEEEKRKANNYTPESDENDSRKKKKKRGCCWNWGLGFYTFLCILGFVLLLVVGIVSFTYSDKMTQFDTLDVVRDQGDEWLSTLEEKLETQVLTLADEFPVTWNRTQAVAGCCGWSLKQAAAGTDGLQSDTTAAAGAATDSATTAAAADPAATDPAATDPAATDPATTGAAADDAATTGAAAADPTTAAAVSTTDAPPLAGGRRALADASTVTGFTNSKCCQNADAITSVNIVDKVQFEIEGCRQDDGGNVYTCQGVVANYIQNNLVRIAIISIVLAIAQLTLAVSSCVVRFPQCFKCCNCEGEKKAPGSHVEPTN